MGAVSLDVGGTQLQVVELNGSRKILGLFSAVTETQMPALTGQKSLYWGEGSGPSSAGSTGHPVDGGLLWNDPLYGLQWKSKYNVETTLAVMGANETVKRRLVEWKSDLTIFQTVSTSIVTVAGFDVSDFNGLPFEDGTLVVRGKCVSFGSVSNYVGYAEVVAVIRVAAGVVSLVGSRAGFDDSGGQGIIGLGTPTAIIDVSGTTVRMRVTTFASGGQLMAYMEVHGAETGN